MQKQKGISLIIIVALVALIAMGAAGFFAWQYFAIKFQQQTTQNQEQDQQILDRQFPLAGDQPSEPVPSETAGWKTYTNNEYGFEIKYPNDWSVDKTTVMSYIYCDYPKRNSMPCEGLVGVGIGAPGPSIKIEYEKISLDNFVKEYNDSGLKITNQEKFVLGGIEGTKLIGTTEIGLDKTIIFVIKNNISYIISFTEIAEVIQYKIISTFKFIK